jgi:hypothetical protein
MIFVLSVCVVLVVAVQQKSATTKRALGWTPQQIHLSWTSVPSEMLVTWVSYWGSATRVHYGPYGSPPTMQVDGQTTAFDPSGLSVDTRYIHRAVMKNLTAAQRYSYYVEDMQSAGTSDTYDFVAQRTDKQWVARYAVYGDFGYENAESLPIVQAMYDSKAMDAIIHNGDFGYNLDDLDGLIGDWFFNQIQPFAARLA